jgi:hypothetical protein
MMTTPSGSAEPSPRSIRETIRAELAAHRDTFHALLDQLADADLARHSANPAWTIRELLFHIVLSLEYVPREVRAAQRGRRLLPLSRAIYDPLNTLLTRLLAWGQTRQSLARKYDAAYGTVLQVLDTVHDDEWPKTTTFFYVEATIENLFRRQTQHLAEHVTDIRTGLA